MAKANPAAGKRGAAAQNHLKEALDETLPVFPYPADLPEGHKETWLRTVNTKTGDYWSKGDVPLLKLYCRVATDIERLSEDIEVEGEVIHNANGNPVVNPKIVVRGYAESRLMALCTKLRLQPSSRMNSDGEERQGRKKAKAQLAAGTIKEDDDDLLAGASGRLQ